MRNAIGGLGSYTKHWTLKPGATDKGGHLVKTLDNFEAKFKNMKISIVMPAYNASKYIEETILSVVGQTFREWELIIIDDASTDNTVEIVEDYIDREPRISLVKLETNFGAPAGPRNRGVSESRYDWIAFLDSDDLWHEKKLEIQVAVLKKTEALFLSTQMQRFKTVASFDRALELDESIPTKSISYIRQLIRYATPTSSVLVRKDVILRCLFEENIMWRAREDLDCWLRIHRYIGHSVKIELPLVGYRVISGQISGNKFEMIRKTYFCFRNSKGVPNFPLGILPLILTVFHFTGAVINRLIGNKL